MLMQPGQSIQPGQTPVADVPQNIPSASPPAPSQPDETKQDDIVEAIPSGPEVSWSASEFIAHSKTFGWYAILFLSAIGLAAVVYLLTRDVITAGVIVFAALLFGIMAARKPRELPYKVSSDGLHIGEKFYSYDTFKSFSVVQEEGIESIWFMPLKRFMPGLSIYFAPNDGQKIVDVLSNYLPFEAKELDLVDRFMHRIRF